MKLFSRWFICFGLKHHGQGRIQGRRDDQFFTLAITKCETLYPVDFGRFIEALNILYFC